MLIVLLQFTSTAVASPLDRSKFVRQNSEYSWDAWQLSLAKSVTYPFFTSVDDVSSVYYVTGNVADSISMGFFLSTSKLIIYGIHEYAWNNFAPVRTEQDKLNYALYKSLTYRLASMSFVFSASLFYMTELSSALMFTLINAAYGATFYFTHELLWNYFGPSIRDHEEPHHQQSPK